MAYDKPELEHIWAEGGAVVEPSDTKKQLGWVAEVPPHQYENWVQRRQDQFIFHVNERGIPEWDGQTNYLEGGRSLVQGSNGGVYKSVAASGPSSVVQNPTTDAANTYWEQAYPGNDDSRLSDAREWTASTVSQAEAEAGTATTRRAWTAQRVRQAITGWWSGIRANHLPLQSSIPQIPSANNVQEALAGLGQLGTNFATATEAQALESLTKILSPGRLVDAFKGGNQSLTTNGYQILPGGLIIQWGMETGRSSYTATFPIAFPNAIINCWATTNETLESPVMYTAWASVDPGGLTNLALRVTGVASGAPIERDKSVRWLAIGH